jgi:poly(hydroxyalkanoate) granule-associated protein
MATSRSRTRKTAGSRTERSMRDVFKTAQETMQSRVGGAREQAQETWDNLEALFQSRVQRALHQLGVPTAEEIRALTRRVSELNDSVSRIVERQHAAQPKNSARRAKRKVAAAPRRAPAKRSKTAG